MMSTSVQEQQHQLHKNQVYMAWFARGTMLLVTSGSMQVSRSTAAAAEPLFAEAILLHEGECYIAERNGWLCLRRDNGPGPDCGDMTRVMQIEPQSAHDGNFLRRLAQIRSSIRLAVARRFGFSGRLH